MSEGTAKYLSLTREQLYELVWSMPGRRLSAELEVSDVAIAKRCKKLNVPRLPRGYWAILTAGGKPRRPPLAPPQEELAAVALRKPVQWTENGRCSLESVLAEVVRGVIQHYEAVEKQREREAEEERKRRAAEAERWQREREEEAIRRKRKQCEEHPGRLQAAARHRMDDLVRAAVWWEVHGTVMEFIRVCEQRWRQEQEGVLTPEQEALLGWAREAALAMSPFPAGYPDPERDGAFDAAAIPVGGPYPESRNLPDPPTFPKTPPSVTSPGYHDHGGSPGPKPYPFWLRHPKR